MPLKKDTALKIFLTVCVFAYCLGALSFSANAQEHGTPEIEVDMSVLGTLPRQAIAPGTVSRPALTPPDVNRTEQAAQPPRLTVYPVRVREVSGAIDPGLQEPVREVVTAPPLPQELERPATPIQKIMPMGDISTFEPVKAPAQIRTVTPSADAFSQTENILEHGNAAKVARSENESLVTARFTPPIPDKKPTFFVAGQRTTPVKGNVMPPARIAAKPKPIAVNAKSQRQNRSAVTAQSASQPKPERIRVGAFDVSEKNANRIEAMPLEKTAYIIPGEPTMPAVPARTVKAEPLKTNQIPTGAKDALTRNLKHVDREDMVNIVSDISSVAGKMAEKNEKAGRARTVTKFENNGTIPRMPQTSAPLEAQKMEVQELQVANIASEALLAASLAEMEPAAASEADQKVEIHTGLSNGAFEIAFGSNEADTLGQETEKALRHNVLSVLRNEDDTRVQISSFGALNGGVTARKESLSRALVIRDFLISNGINAERIDVKALTAEQAEKENKVSFNFSS